MIKFLVIILISFILCKALYAYEDIYETKFYEININNEIIADAKNREINLIIKNSFYNILRKILTEENYKKLKKKNYDENQISYLVKNIIIEDEFISDNKYSSKVKVNFENSEIIQLLRNNKINYTDFSSSDILIVFAESKNLILSGLSGDNNFYKSHNLDNYGLINLIYPDLSPNDRYILPYDKIIKKDLKALKIISKKYDVNYIYLVNSKNLNFINYVDASVYSLAKNKIVDKIKYSYDVNYKHQDKLFIYLDNWWKRYNLVDNTIINKKKCYVKNSNIHELYFIKSKILSISQVDSLILNNINLGLNAYDLLFYGGYLNLYSKLLEFKIKIESKENKDCLISILN